MLNTPYETILGAIDSKKKKSRRRRRVNRLIQRLLNNKRNILVTPMGRMPFRRRLLGQKSMLGPEMHRYVLSSRIDDMYFKTCCKIRFPVLALRMGDLRF